MLGGGSQSAINRHMAESRLGWLNMGWRTNLYYQSPFANSMWSWQGKEFRLHNRSDVRQAAAESIVNAVARINSKDDLRVPGTPAYLTVPDDIRDVAQHGSDARPVAESVQRADINAVGYTLTNNNGNTTVNRKKVDLATPGDYGYDPLFGNDGEPTGFVQMIPSGDILTPAAAKKRMDGRLRDSRRAR